MDQQQPGAPAGNPYEFIFNPPKPPKRSGRMGMGSVSSNSWGVKIAFIVGGAALVLVILAIIVNLTLGKRTNTAELILITETQNEIARVATQGVNADDQLVRNAAVSTQLTVTSQQQTMLAFLQGRGKKVSTKTLLLKRNASTDKQLTAATAASNFDPVFTQTMVGQLNSYASSVKTAYNNAVNTTERALLANEYNQTQALIKQWPSPQQTTQQ
ncbi:MAG TPA: hypothetical protein VJP80_07900 [Candidatus Saccharimonadales bacterium]|nr:hypothetical protein [Candidatus Saccharimonadales bacterium]